jgi:electron transport complex protein RnfB
MHAVIEQHCTGCGLCLPVCPVDCIEMENVSGQLTGWGAWSDQKATHARDRYAAHQSRLAQTSSSPTALVSGPSDVALETPPHEANDTRSDADKKTRKKTMVQAALARAQTLKSKPIGPKN